LLLRRPISPAVCHSESTVSNLDNNSRRSNSLPTVISENIVANDVIVPDISESLSNLVDKKKTLKVAIDIPLCNNTHPDKGIDCEEELTLDKCEQDIVEFCACDIDDVQSVQSFKSGDSPR